MVGVIILLVYYSTLGTIGIILNALLLYLSIFRTPSQIKTYRILIINFALTDMLSSILMMFIAPRIIPLNFSMAHIFYGLAHYTGPVACYAFYSALLHLFLHSMWSLLLSFAYRTYILSSAPPSNSKVVLFNILIYIPSFVQFIVFMFTAADPNVIIEKLRNKFPSYEFDYTTVSGISNALSPASVFSILNLTLPVFPIYTAILILRRKILVKLGKNTEHLRLETKTIHRQLLKALTCQACLPILFLCGTFIFFIQAIQLVESPILECLICVVPAPIPILSSITSLYHIGPYRRALFQMFSRIALPAPTNERHSSAVVLAPNHKVSVLSISRLYRLSIPNNA